MISENISFDRYFLSATLLIYILSSFICKKQDYFLIIYKKMDKIVWGIALFIGDITKETTGFYAEYYSGELAVYNYEVLEKFQKYIICFLFLWLTLTEIDI